MLAADALVLAAAAHTSHASPLLLALIACVVSGLWALSLLVHPSHTCPNCGGKCVIQARHGFRKCPACDGRGRRHRFGAVTVHRLLWSAAGDRFRSRRTHTIRTRHQQED